MLDDDKIKLINEQTKKELETKLSIYEIEFKEKVKQDEEARDSFIRKCFSDIYDINEEILKLDNKMPQDKETIVEIQFLKFKKQEILNKLTP